MNSFFKRVHVRLIELERKRSWLLTQTGINPSTWSSWEKYGRMPSADRAMAIADALGVSLEFLITGKHTPFDFRFTNPLVFEIHQKLVNLDDQQLRDVLAVINTIQLEQS